MFCSHCQDGQVSTGCFTHNDVLRGPGGSTWTHKCCDPYCEEPCEEQNLDCRSLKHLRWKDLSEHKGTLQTEGQTLTKSGRPVSEGPESSPPHWSYIIHSFSSSVWFLVQDFWAERQRLEPRKVVWLFSRTFILCWRLQLHTLHCLHLTEVTPSS